MKPDTKIPVILAPALAADRATSMDLYLANILPALAPYADRFDFEVVAPPSTPQEPWAAKQWKRYVAFPRLLARHRLAHPGAVLHVLDQSYGHLCRTDVPTVLTCHGLENFRLKLPHFWQQALWLYRVRGMQRAGRVLAISQDVANITHDEVHVPSDRIQINYHGMEDVFTPRGKTNPALEARRAAGERLVLHVGTNIPRKNIGRLLEAVSHLRTEGLPVRFVKVGADPREDGYLEQIQSLGLLDHFDYLGWLDAPALAEVYRTCDVLAFPSIHEGFGRPIIEAQACGLPVVVADTDSAREIGGDATLRHVPTDAADLAAKLRAVLLEPGTRERLAAAGLENLRRFSWSEHARILTEAYTALHAAAR